MTVRRNSARSHRRPRGGRRSASASSSAARRARRRATTARSSIGADGEDRGLRRVEDGDELLDAEHAEVRDRERPALEVVRAELAVARARDERRRARRRSRRSRARSALADHRHDEPVRRRDGDARRSRSGSRWIASSAKCAFTSRWRTARRAQTFVRTSVTVGSASPSAVRSTSARERERARHVGRDRELEDGRLPTPRSAGARSSCAST